MLVPDLLEGGLLLFNKGDYYEAHEVWEDFWREITDPVLKRCCQGLIQAAVGLHHLRRGNEVGARSQLHKSIRNLQAGAEAPTGLDIPDLIRQLSEVIRIMPEVPSLAPPIARRK